MSDPTPDFSPEAIAEALRAVVKAARQGDARTECGSCDYGLAMGCTCGPMDTALALLDGIGLDPLAQLLAALEAERVAHAETRQKAQELHVHVTTQRDNNMAAWQTCNRLRNEQWEKLRAAEAALEAKDGEVARLRGALDAAATVEVVRCAIQGTVDGAGLENLTARDLARVAIETIRDAAAALAPSTPKDAP